jgi:hypothetical protein
MESQEIFYPLFRDGCRTCRRSCRSERTDGCPADCGDKGTCGEGEDALSGRSLAMVYSPKQPFCDLYEPDEGLSRGTIFAALEKPFCGDGRQK